MKDFAKDRARLRYRLCRMPWLIKVLLPSPADPSACTQGKSWRLRQCRRKPQVAPFLNVVEFTQRSGFQDGTGQITTTQRRITNEDYVMGRFDYTFSEYSHGIRTLHF